MYTLILTLHNLTRWAILVLGVYVLYRAYRGWNGNVAWTENDRKASLWFGAAMGIQFILGVLFYFTPGSVANVAVTTPGAISSSIVRFFTMEHSVVMFVAVIISNVAMGAARRAPTDKAKFRRMAILNTIAILLVLVAIPWPGLSYGRPLFRIG